MKRGFLRERWENDRSRRPRSRIEERLRHRKLHQLQQRIKSSGIVSNETIDLNSTLNTDPSIELSNRSTSSSDTSSPRVFTSKQCVDLLEMVFLDAAVNRTRKYDEISSSTIPKNAGRNRSPFAIRKNNKVRPRSAPCSPLFTIKCAKQKCVRDIFVDYKLVERNRIGEDRKKSKLSSIRQDPLRENAFLRLSKSQEFQRITRQESYAEITEKFSKDLRSFDIGSSGSTCIDVPSGCEQQIDHPETFAPAVDILTLKKIPKVRTVEWQTVLEKKSTSRLVADPCNIHADSSKLNNSVPEEDGLEIPEDQRDSVVETSPRVSVLDVRSDDAFHESIEQHGELSENATVKLDDTADISFVAATAADPEDTFCSTATISTILLAGVESTKSVNVSRDADDLRALDSSKQDQSLPEDRSCRCTIDHLPAARSNVNENNRTASNEKLPVNDFRESCRFSPQWRCGTSRNCIDAGAAVPADQNLRPVAANISGARCIHGKCRHSAESCSGDASSAIVDDRQHRRCHSHVCRKVNDSKNLCCCGQRSNLRQRRVTFCLPGDNFAQLTGNCVDSRIKRSNRCVRQVREDDRTGKVMSAEIEVREEQRTFSRNTLQLVEELVTSRDVASVFNDRTKDRSCSQCCNYVGTNRRMFCNEIVNKRRDILGGACSESNDENVNAEDRRSPVTKDEDFKDRVDSDEDWTLSPKQNVLASNDDITFPKETRRAMNVLLHGRTSLRSKKCNDSEMQEQSLNEERMPSTSEIVNDPECRTMHVPTYAKALAVFQRTCDPLAGGCRRKKRQVVWKGSDGDIHSEYTSASECTLQKFGKQSHSLCERRNLFLRSTSNSDLYPGIGIMQSNGSDSGSSENGVDRTGWTVGLINGKYKYLTAETFGFKINANGASLKKKQLWILEGSEHQVFLRSHLDRYLAVDQFGNVTCEAEDLSDPGCAFQIQIASDGSGRWALKNVQRGYFLGSSQDELKCTAKAPGETEYWLVHLAARPQVNLRSAGRKRFAHLSTAQDEIHVDAPVPWGEDTLFTLEFRHVTTVDNDADAHGDQAKTEGGHYALHTCNNKYLAHDGKLLDTCTRDCLYAAEFHAGLLALRDVHGAYLAPIGSKAVLKSRSTTVTRDELFSLEESLPQASFVAALNQRYVSVKQGVDVTANQDEISGHETFQLEFDRVTKRWYVRTMQDRYWSLEAGGGIQASDHKRSSNALFDLIWQPEDGTVALRANNGKFLATKRSGHLYANADSLSGGDSDVSKYFFYLMNRPVLVLRSEQGFVGPKSAASPKLECNKAAYETIRVERCERGVVRFKGQNGKYWHADSEGVTVDSDVPSDGFYLELREPSRICIKSTDGRYLTAGKNGALRLGETDYDTATKWEF